MKIQTEKCPKCSKEFEADSEKYYWHLKIHNEMRSSPIKKL